MIPGLYDGHNKAFYFINYEEFRLPITSATTRQYVSPAAQGGLFQYGCTAAGCSSSVNILQLAARNGQLGTVDPTVASMLAQINDGDRHAGGDSAERRSQHAAATRGSRTCSAPSTCPAAASTST